MSSVSGVSSSNTTSIYGNRNVLSGLASGLDTESMVENAVSGYKTKINTLKQKETKITWKQTAYRDLTDPMVQFTRKYASYSSSTNLISASYFNKSTITVSNGVNAANVSASGQSDSNVKILDISQMAKAAVLTTSADRITGRTNTVPAVTAAETMDLTSAMDLSAVSGSLTLLYGGNHTIDISFGELELYKAGDDGKTSAVDALVKGINQKLAETQTFDSEGQLAKASTFIKAEKDADGNIAFSDARNAGNTVAISGASGKIAATLGIQGAEKESVLHTSGMTSLVDSSVKGEFLAGKALNVTIDGKTKTITLPSYNSGASNADEEFVSSLNTALQSKFGTSFSASMTADKKLQVTGPKGSSILLSSGDSSVTSALGFSENLSSSYLNTGATLGALLSVNTVTENGVVTGETLGTGSAGILKGIALKGTGTIKDKGDGTYCDTLGNLTDENGNRLGSDGKQLYGYDMTINGVKIGTYTRDAALDSVLRDINSNTEAGVFVSFSKTTNSFLMSAKETGANNDIEITDAQNNLAAELFETITDGKDASGAPVTGYTAGQDAVFSMEVNGQQFSDITRNDNTFDVDGMSLTLKGTFEQTDANSAITFTTTADADKIISNIKDMVDDLNKILMAAHDAYSTQPLTKSDNKTRYEPLTDDDKEDMSETAIKNYEDKAKTGLLFGDSDLSNLYSKLVSAVEPFGSDARTLSSIGIGTSYSDGVTTLTLDEAELKTALENNPDAVRDAFTKTTGNGGLMTNLKSVFDIYASVEGASKGILVEKAGSTYSSLSMLSNTLQSQLGDLDDEIDKWEERMSDKIDYYSEQFSKLEQLTSEMNSQSSMLTGMLGG